MMATLILRFVAFALCASLWLIAFIRGLLFFINAPLDVGHLMGFGAYSGALLLLMLVIFCVDCFIKDWSYSS